MLALSSVCRSAGFYPFPDFGTHDTTAPVLSPHTQHHCCIETVRTQNTVYNRGLTAACSVIAFRIRTYFAASTAPSLRHLSRAFKAFGTSIFSRHKQVDSTWDTKSGLQLRVPEESCSVLSLPEAFHHLHFFLSRTSACYCTEGRERGS